MYYYILQKKLQMKYAFWVAITDSTKALKTVKRCEKYFNVPIFQHRRSFDVV